MSDPYLSDYADYHDQFQSRSPSSDRSERRTQMAQQDSSDESNSPPSYGRSLPKASKIIEILQKNSNSLSKDHRNPSKQVSQLKNSHNQHNYIPNEIKAKGKEVQLKKPRNSDSPQFEHSYEDLYVTDSRQERFTKDFYDYDGLYPSDFKGKAEERRTPVEPKKTKKDSVSKGARGEEKGEYYPREDRRKHSSHHLDFSGEEFLKSLAREKYKDHVKYFDISETTSEIWYADESTRSQNKSMKSKSTKSDGKQVPADLSALIDPDLDDLMRKLTTQSKNSRKNQDEYSQKKSVEVATTKGNYKEVESKRETNKENLRLMEQLKKFPLNELRITKKGSLDMRSKVAESYLNLCEKVNQDPLEFYEKNYHKWEQKIVRKAEASDEESEFQKVLNEMKMKSKGNIEPKGKTESRNMKHQEKGVLRAVNAQKLNQSGYSDELSYKGSESDDESFKKSMTRVQKQSEKDDKIEMRMRAFEDLEKFNYAAIRVTKEGGMDKKFKEEKEKLYFKFCQNADVHPIEYYRETGKKSVSKENLEERIITLLKNDGFEIKSLIFTKHGLPHKSSVSKPIKNWLVKYGYYD